MKKLSLLIILLWGTVPTQVFAQQINSHITSSYYLANPKGYLSKLDNAIIPSNVLLDRALPTSPIDDFSGSGTVLTGTFTEWSNLFFEQMNSTAGGYNMDAWLALEKAYLHRVRDEEIVPIIIQNIKYAKVNAQAISNGLLYEQDSFLVENASYKSQILSASGAQREQLIANLYTTHRTFAGSTVYGRIHGNSITFELDSNFYFSNIKNETIQSIKIDFGNGTGYQFVDWNTPITVAYAGTSTFIECAVKFEIIDSHNTLQTLYTHFTVLRTGDDVVPDLEGTTNGRASINPGERFYFPDGPTGVYETDAYQNGERQFIPGWVMDYLTGNYMPGEVSGQATVSRWVCVDEETYCSYMVEEFFAISNMYYLRIWKADNAALEVSILYAPNNQSGKLRKPILILDGFDPGNKRSYYISYGDDPRGLFEVMNGNLHIYYDDPTTSNTIAVLRGDLGYDLVFVDFLNGDDYMQLNGDRVVDLFAVLNGSTYRDEFTEEWVVVGPSMGGLISRYALKTMEDESTPHYVRQWVSFDSPHQGAYVPLALQQTLYLLRGIDATGKAQQGLNDLRSPAARQLMIRHIDSDVGDWRGSFLDLMDNLEFPEKLEKIAISNGALANLYEIEVQDYIINFRAFASLALIIGRKLVDNTGQQLVVNSSGPLIESGNYYAANTLPYENMPGGYLDHLKRISHDKKNKSSITGVHQEIATHIPLLSAFGVPVSRNNYGGTNLYWAMQSGPFDKIHFQPTSYNINDIIPLSKANNGNQIHMTITKDTKEYLKDQMEENIDNIRLPHYYSDEFLAEPYVEHITGDVAYNAKITIEFSSIYQNQAEVIIESGANVNSTAGESITLKTGFYVKTGASFSAKIVSSTGGRVANATVLATTPINYANPSGYSNNKHSYAPLAQNKIVPTNVENSTVSLFSVYPTVSNGIYTIANKELGEYAVEVINSVGQSIIASTPNLKKIDIASQTGGFYFVRIISKNKSYLFKILKK